MLFGWIRKSNQSKIGAPKVSGDSGDKPEHPVQEHWLRVLSHLVSFLPLLVVIIFASLEVSGQSQGKIAADVNSPSSEPRTTSLPQAPAATQENLPSTTEKSLSAEHKDEETALLRICLFFAFAATTVALENCFNSLREFGEWVDFREHEIDRLLHRHREGANDRAKEYRKTLAPVKLQLRWFKVKTAFSIVLWLVVGYCEARHVIGFPITQAQSFAVGISTIFVLCLAGKKLWLVTEEQYAAKNAVIHESDDNPPQNKENWSLSRGGLIADQTAIDFPY